MTNLPLVHHSHNKRNVVVNIIVDLVAVTEFIISANIFLLVTVIRGIIMGNVVFVFLFTRQILWAVEERFKSFVTLLTNLS